MTIRDRFLGLLLLSAFAVFPPSASSHPAPQQDRLDETSNSLTNAYLDAEMIGKYGYLEVEYPRSFKKDGRGPIKTKPIVQAHSQTLIDEAREWIANLSQALGEAAPDKRTLGEIVRILSNQRQFTRIVPFADRYVSAGGKLGITGQLCYIGGLVRLGRYSEAVLVYTTAVQRWGPKMTQTMSAQLYGDRFTMAWLVERDFAEMLAAHEQAILHGIFPGDANSIQDTLVGLLRRAAERKELPWFAQRMEKHWIWLSDARLKACAECFTKAGLAAPPALVAASDPTFKGLRVPPEALSQRASDSLNRGESETAVRQAERAVELAKPSSYKAHFEALVTLTRVHRQTGNLEKAFELTNELEGIAKKINEAPEIGWALVIKGFLYERLADYRRAADCHGQAFKIGQSIGYADLMFQAEAFAARALSHTGMAEQVEDTLRETAQGYLKERIFTEVPAAYMNWGECLLLLGRHEAAAAAFRQALEPVKEAGADFKIDLFTQLACRKGLASALLGQDKYKDAEKAYDDYGTLSKQTQVASAAWVWQLGKAKCKRGQKKDPEALSWVIECLKSIEAERASLTDYKHRRTLNDNKYEAYELAVSLLLDQGDANLAFLLAEQSRARAFLDEMGGQSSGAQASPTEDLTSFAKECRDVCAVVYYQLPDRLLVWVAADGKGEVVTLDVTTKEMEARVQEFLTAIYLQSQLLEKHVSGAKRWNAVQSAKSLAQLIWAPIAGRLPAGKPVCIVPHRALHYIPFQALHDGTKYLIESREVFYAPSANALLELRRRNVDVGEDVLVFDPLLSNDPKSPFAKTESQALKEQYPAGKFVLRDAATLAAFKESSKTAGIIHISSHGYYNPWVPTESGLLFAGAGAPEASMLRAKDVYSMRLDKTRLIVMSACVSSVGDFADGDEVTGVTRAFQVAGVPEVIGSLWPVENDVTIQLMTLFHRKLAETQNPATALRWAQSEMIKKTDKISNWAAFQLTGVGQGIVRKGK
jgi:CHAT domain-containing protein